MCTWFGKQNVEGEIIMEFADALNFVIANIGFKKEEGRLITYESDASRTVIDYILIRKTERKLIWDYQVIRQEKYITGLQHKLLIYLCSGSEGRTVP